MKESVGTAPVGETVGGPMTESQPVAEAVRLLDGRVAGTDVDELAPVWVAVNALAHSDLYHLRALAHDRTRLARDTWGEWFTRLASEIAELAATEDELVEVQREILVPLELQLLDDRVAMPSTPDQVLAAIGEALGDRRLRSGE
jgi:hypothetical protein